MGGWGGGDNGNQLDWSGVMAILYFMSRDYGIL